MLKSIHDQAIGKWRSILPVLGIDPKFLTNRHGPCPICGGKDRFRFDDKEGKGTFFCSGCGPGTGVDLVMRVARVDFKTAVRLIEPHLPDAPVVVPKAVEGRLPDGRAAWQRGLPILRDDAVSRYLEKRGIVLDEFPSQLRIMAKAMYKHEDGSKENFPAMIANFVSPCREWTTVHITYLTPGGEKAAVPKVRKFYPGKIPQGGAVRLAPSAETMGVAEGIETALSAMQMFEVPVWATLSAIGMTKWEPPETVRNVLIFGDSDEKFAGHHAAYALAYRLVCKGLHVEVRMPQEVGTDWNDVLMSERRVPA